MKTYPLELSRSKHVFDIPTIDKITLLIISCFFAVLCIGIIYFGGIDYYFSFYAVLSIYAAFLGFLFARSAYKRKLATQKNFPVLRFLSKNQRHTELVFDPTTNIILYQNKPFGNTKVFEEKVVSNFFNSLGLHAIDRARIKKILLPKASESFKEVFEIEKGKGISQWISIETQSLLMQDKNYILVNVKDISKEKHNSKTQLQYIQDMERIIQNQRTQSPLHLVNQMAFLQQMQSPLQQIKSHIRTIENDYKAQLDQKGQMYIQKMAQETYQLDTLMNDFFSISGIDEEHTKEDNINLNKLIQAVLNNLKDKIEQSGAQIAVPKLPNIQADRNQLILLFQNLIENAINYCGSQPPSIELTWYQDKNHLVFNVSDRGIGISNKYKKQIFDNFNRGQLNTANSVEGLGLGLTICKQIIQNHNGEIWVESQGTGKGATFSFALPQESVARPLHKVERAAIPVAATA